MQAIFEIDVNRRTPKYQQIANSITKAIRLGKIKRGDRILSINELSNEFMLSRDTVQKAYYLLEKEQILQAVRGKGFYINRTDVFQRYKVLLVFDILDSFSRKIFEGLVNNLGNRAVIDVKIFQNNETFVHEMHEAVAAEYDYCIFMPQFCEKNESALRVMACMPPDKMILLDRQSAEKFPEAIGVYDDFDTDIFVALQPAVVHLKKYKSICYLHPEAKKFDASRLNGFGNLCRQTELKPVVRDKIDARDVIAHRCFLVKDEDDVIALVKIADQKKLVPGADIGIISLHESKVHELLAGGITTLCADPLLLGEAAARVITDQKRTRLNNPFVMSKRKSL